MCDFSGRLIAWMDCELEANEAAVLGLHVRGCAECRERVAAYEDVSRGFAAYCNVMLETAMVTKIHRKLPRWVPVVAGAAAVAAVVLVLASLPRSVQPVPVIPRVAEARTPIAPKLGPMRPTQFSGDTLPPIGKLRPRLGRWLSPPSRSPSQAT